MFRACLKNMLLFIFLSDRSERERYARCLKSTEQQCTPCTVCVHNWANMCSHVLSDLEISIIQTIMGFFVLWCNVLRLVRLAPLAKIYIYIYIVYAMLISLV